MPGVIDPARKWRDTGELSAYPLVTSIDVP